MLFDPLLRARQSNAGRKTTSSRKTTLNRKSKKEKSKVLDGPSRKRLNWKLNLALYCFKPIYSQQENKTGENDNSNTDKIKTTDEKKVPLKDRIDRPVDIIHKKPRKITYSICGTKPLLITVFGSIITLVAGIAIAYLIVHHVHDPTRSELSSSFNDLMYDFKIMKEILPTQ